MFLPTTVSLCVISFAAAQFPTLPPPSPNPSTGYICVAQGTCITGGGTGPGSIDPRIVTQPQPPAGSCPAGQVACYPQVGGMQCGSRHATGINIGDGASSFGAFPWQAYMWRQGAYIGSGVLIDEWHVLTAAHKVANDRNTPQNIQVYMGVWDPALKDQPGQTQRRTATAIDVANGYNSTTLRNDLAIIRLNACIGLGYQTNVGRICMPAFGESFFGQCIVSGWGQTGFGANDAPTNPQKQVTVPIVPYANCLREMGNVLGGTNNANVYLDEIGEICAGGEAGKDACTQDGGAPLVCQGNQGFVVAGLVIWGKGCGRANVPGVYVKVSQYKNWIDQQVARYNQNYGSICTPR